MDQDDPRDHFSLLNRFWMVLGYSLFGNTPLFDPEKGRLDGSMLEELLDTGSLTLGSVQFQGLYELSRYSNYD